MEPDSQKTTVIAMNKIPEGTDEEMTRHNRFLVDKHDGLVGFVQHRVSVHFGRAEIEQPTFLGQT